MRYLVNKFDRYRYQEVFMFRRVAAVGAPPLLLLVGTFLLVHYQSLILNTVWDGALPDVWRNGVFYLPVMLAAVGVVVGLRMHSSGVLIVMLTLGVVFGVLNPSGVAGLHSLGNMRWDSPGFLFLMPVNYLLGLWTLRYSWQSRRGIGALLVALVWVATLATVTIGIPAAGITRWVADLMTTLPVDMAAFMNLWEGALLAVIVAGYMLVHAIRCHDPIAAGLGASLLMTLPFITRGLDPLSMAIVSSAAVLVVLVGILESMFALAYRDGLTGLPGRRGLNDMLRQLGRRYAIAMLDVDHFKRFNDRFGHRTGDDVLKMIATRMRSIPGGRPFRYGGEEFAVIFTGRSAQNAAYRMERFREGLARAPFVIRRVPRSNKKARGRKTTRMTSRQRVRITVSIGVATSGKRGHKASDVLVAADKLLYKAKKTGRNRVVA
jgi:diguanylate cyclase (GGDEF)-like protein